MGSKDKDAKKKKKKPKDYDAEIAMMPGEDKYESTASETPETPASQDAPPDFAPEAPKRRRRRKWPIILIVLAVLAALFILPRFFGFNRTASDTGRYEAYTVSRGDITVTLSGSGTLQPADEYTIRPLVSGDILEAPFEEGDIVQKDDMLYTVDSSDVASSIEQAENNLSDAQTNYNHALEARDDLNMTSGGSGTVAEISVQIGDTVAAGQTLATVRDSDVMTFTALFQREFAEKLHTGDSIDVTLSETFETFTGTVTEIDAVDTVLPGSIIARAVTVEVPNPGAFSTSQTPYATVDGTSSISCSAFSYKYEGPVTATVSGIVDDIPELEGSRVTRGQTIVVLHSDTVQQQIENAQSTVRDAKLALQNASANLEDYTIRSPISGTIVEKNLKEGDTLETGSSVCTVFDLSYLTLTLNVDELDIKKVAPGQSVTITADASEGAVYTGAVTKININGTTMNGVTSYPVTIRIDKTEGLLPGMNVDATVTVASLEDVLTVPVGALLRGNFVLLKSGAYDPETAEAGTPAGFVYTEVTPGASNDADVVITAGIKEGDVIAILDTTPSTYNAYPFMMSAEQQEDRTEDRLNEMTDGD